MLEGWLVLIRGHVVVAVGVDPVFRMAARVLLPGRVEMWQQSAGVLLDQAGAHTRQNGALGPGDYLEPVLTLDGREHRATWESDVAWRATGRPLACDLCGRAVCEGGCYAP